MTDSAAPLDIGELSLFASDIIRQMGREALDFYGQGRRHLPFDQNLVTRAELHLNNTFQQLMRERYEGHRIYE
ncbi:MAG: inositol monophosphatase, partial [Desulfatitalea sp.]|nr:hypothetical protein [Desulfatitalea sp.]NNK01025.1 inositol monophosphatase [Desulfatitalea sp.]